MGKKHLITIFCIIVGGSSVFAVSHWPQYTVAIQMTLYTIMALGAPFLHFWSERNRRAFWGVTSLAMIAHGLFLSMIRSSFPFHSVLVVVPIALIEAVGIFVAMDKTLGSSSVEFLK
jgi:hypothetical protein